MRVLWFCVVVVVIGGFTVAQSAEPTIRSLMQTPVDSIAPLADSAQVPATEVLTKSPTTAVVYSLLLPGAGQLYNEQYWKIPIFTGTAAVTAVLFFSNNTSFNNADVAVTAAQESGASAFEIARLQRQRESFRDARDVSGLIFVVTYALAAVDSYVGAHLYDFSVNEDLSLGLGPSRSHLMAVNFSVTLR